MTHDSITPASSNSSSTNPADPREDHIRSLGIERCVLETPLSSRTISSGNVLERAPLSRRSVLERSGPILESAGDSRRHLGPLTENQPFQPETCQNQPTKGPKRLFVYKALSQIASRRDGFLDSRTASRILESEAHLERYLQLIQMKRGLSQ